MARKSAVAYAEEDLGVQSVLEEANLAFEAFNNARRELLGMRATKRRIEGLIADREADVAMEIFRNADGASQAAVERHTKLEIGTDTTLRTLREQLREHLDDIDTQETEAALAKTRMEIAIARMTELGGYMQYLAIAKSTAKTTVVRTDPW